MQVHYFTGWFDRKKAPLVPLDPDRAKQLHARGQLYTAVLGDPDRPYCYLDVRLEVGFVGVHFLDELKRTYLTYFFNRAGGRLFLAEIWLRTFEGAGDEAVAREHYAFSEDGTVDTEKYVPGRPIERAQRRDVDVAPHYADIPAFGEYEALARKDR